MKKRLAGCAMALVFTATTGTVVLLAQTAAPDPWQQVPQLPTTCYQSEDFSAPADKASAALQTAIDRQEAINEGIEKEFREMDMAEMAQRMQAFMQKDPQRAMAMMQAMNSASAEVNSDVQRAASTGGPLEEELKGLTAKFRAAVDGVRNPIQAQIDKLVTAKTLPAHGDAIIFANAADEAQYLGLVARLNTDYDKICGAWWGTTGSFQGWLRKLKAFQEEFVLSDDQVAASRAMQFAILEGPTGGYRSTQAMTTVQEYLRRARAVYDLRPHRIAVGKPGDHRQ